VGAPDRALAGVAALLPVPAGAPALLVALINVELALLGESIDLAALPRPLPGYAATLVFVAFLGGGFAFLGGGFEEPGWRGFALPRLQRRHSPLVATLLFGLLWGLWHTPPYGPLGFILPLVLAFYYTWLYNRTGSVLLCILLHASFTPALDKLFLAPDSTTVDLVILGTIAAGAAALVLITRGRLGYDSGPVHARDAHRRRPTPRAGNHASAFQDCLDGGQISVFASVHASAHERQQQCE
jgi:membrane protease YdiL (CAAX protease family)